MARFVASSFANQVFHARRAFLDQLNHWLCRVADINQIFEAIVEELGTAVLLPDEDPPVISLGVPHKLQIEVTSLAQVLQNELQLAHLRPQQVVLLRRRLLLPYQFCALLQVLAELCGQLSGLLGGVRPAVGDGPGLLPFWLLLFLLVISWQRFFVVASLSELGEVVHARHDVVPSFRVHHPYFFLLDFFIFTE